MYSTLCFLSSCACLPKRQLLGDRFAHSSRRLLFDYAVCPKKLRRYSNVVQGIQAQQQTENTKQEETTEISDYEFAERCVEEGCPVEDVQELLVRLEVRITKVTIIYSIA